MPTVQQGDCLSSAKEGNFITHQLLLAGTTNPMWFPIIRWMLNDNEKWESGLDILGEHLVLAAETMGSGGVMDRIAVCRNGDGEVWIGLPNTAQFHPWPGQLTITITSPDMPGIYGQVPFSYNSRLISFAGHEEYFYVDGRTGVSIGMGLTGENNNTKVYISLTNDRPIPGQYSWEIQNQAVTNNFVIRNETAGQDEFIIDGSGNLQVLGAFLIGATKRRNNFAIIGDNTYYAAIAEVGTDAMSLMLTAKGAQYTSLSSGEWMALFTTTRAIGFSAVDGQIEFYTSYALAMKIAQSTQNILIGTTTDGMTSGGSLAVEKDFAHRGTKVGFFNRTPVSQQTKATHNNWASLSDVVQALVDVGLFDAV